MANKEKLYTLSDSKGVVQSSSNKEDIKRTMNELTPNGTHWIIRVFKWSAGGGLFYAGWELVKIIMKSV